MNFAVGSGFFSTEINGSRIESIAGSNSTPEMSLWEKIKSFFCRMHAFEALDCIHKICHPPAGTTREEMAGRFERLRELTSPGYKNNISSEERVNLALSHICIPKRYVDSGIL